jgi:hypothetical protein
MFEQATVLAVEEGDPPFVRRTLDVLAFVAARNLGRHVDLHELAVMAAEAVVGYREHLRLHPDDWYEQPHWAVHRALLVGVFTTRWVLDDRLAELRRRQVDQGGRA